MTEKIKFYLTDVFGERKYTGNQLATFVNTGSLADIEMQQIARELNFSETAFVLSDTSGDGGYDVRIFTPREEIDFAGHPVLGTASVLRKHLLLPEENSVTLRLRVGQVPVFFVPQKSQKTILWMQQAEPVIGDKIYPSIMAKILGLRKSQIDTYWPVQLVSTGLPHIIVPLQDMEALKECRIVDEPYWQFINNSWAKNILVFCSEGYRASQDFSVRVFGRYYGIEEDAATGSGNGCLAAYLTENQYFKTAFLSLQVGQGYEIGRPSTLFLEAVKDSSGRTSIKVGGRVFHIAEGLWG